MDNLSPAASNPFAPLLGLPPEMPKKGEVWLPQLPAVGEPPVPGDIRHTKFGKASRHWVYRDAAGAPLFCVVRFDVERNGQTEKEVLPYSYGQRAWTTAAGVRRDITGWHFKRPTEPVPLYGLDRLAAQPHAAVLVCEGEKTADAAMSIFPNIVPIASQGGGKALQKSDWSILAGRDVTIWPDADEPGWKFARQAAELLREVGAASVRIVQVDLSEFPPKWDLADPLPADIDPEKLQAMLLDAEPASESDAGEDKQRPDDDAAAPEVSAEEAVAEIDRLSRLPRVEYERARKRAAQALLLGVGALDKACAVQRSRRRAEAEAKHRGKPAPVPGEVIWPLGILPCDDGLYFDTGSDAGPTWICEPIEVMGMGRDAHGEAWGLWLRWRDSDRRIHSWPMPSRMLMVQPGELEAALVDKGLRINADPTARGHLRYALNGVKTGSRVAFADTPGWSDMTGGPSVFALINGEVIGSSAEEVVLKAKPENADAKMASVGTLEAWKSDVAAQAEGNPVAAFAICAAFAGPLLLPLGESSGGFHFFGRSKAGKTLALRLGISVWGSTRKSGLLKDWRSTANALEGAAEECNDGFLTLDEIHQAEPKDVVVAVYQLANESGKQRLTKDAVTKRRRTWRAIVMSTGEIDIAGMAAKASPSPLPAGAEVRLPSIPIDGRDMWPNLHGQNSASDLMAVLQQTVLAQYGTAIRAYLNELTECLASNDGMLEQAIEVQRAAFYAVLPEGADAQVKEVARRCALIALAGEMAIEWDILPWERGEATKTAQTVLDWWINRRGGVGATEESQHVKAVRAYLSEFGTARFVALNMELDESNNGKRWVERHPDRPIQSRSGWRRASAANDGDEYLLDRDGWSKMCAQSGADPHEVAKTLLAAGHLDQGDGKNLAKTVRLPTMGKVRCYVVKPSIFASSHMDVAEKAA